MARSGGNGCLSVFGDQGGERLGRPGLAPGAGIDERSHHVLSVLTRQLLIEFYPGFNPAPPRKFGFDKPALVGTPGINSDVREHAHVLGTIGVESKCDYPAKVGLTGAGYGALVCANGPNVVVLDRGLGIDRRAIDLAGHVLTAGVTRVDIVSTDLTPDGFMWTIEPDLRTVQ